MSEVRPEGERAQERPQRGGGVGAALPDFTAWAATLAEVVENALSPALEGGRVHSCLHAVDETDGMIIGQTKVTDRMAFLCAEHPDRLLCDKPGNAIGPGCVLHHMQSQHKDEVPAMCFVCRQPIEELLVRPVFAKIELHRPLPVYYDWAREYRYLGPLRTLPVTYLCPRHAGLFNPQRPWLMHWPLVADDLTPADFIGK